MSSTRFGVKYSATPSDSDAVLVRPAAAVAALSDLADAAECLSGLVGDGVVAATLSSRWLFHVSVGDAERGAGAGSTAPTPTPPPPRVWKTTLSGGAFST